MLHCPCRSLYLVAPDWMSVLHPSGESNSACCLQAQSLDDYCRWPGSRSSTKPDCVGSCACASHRETGAGAQSGSCVNAERKCTRIGSNLKRRCVFTLVGDGQRGGILPRSHLNVDGQNHQSLSPAVGRGEQQAALQGKRCRPSYGRASSISCLVEEAHLVHLVSYGCGNRVCVVAGIHILSRRRKTVNGQRLSRPAARA